MGIEPTSSAWKAEVLPLNYTRLARALSSEITHPKNRRLLPCGEGGRIYSGPQPYSGHSTPRTLRAAALCAAFEIAPGDFVNLLSVLILPFNCGGETTLWWRGEDLNLRRLSRQIYSLIPLTTREPLPKIKPAIVLYALMSVNINTSFNRDSRPLPLNGSHQHVYT